MGITVLQVEDNYWYYDSAKKYLEKHEIYIETWVDSLERAVEELKKRDYDFILVDMELYGDKRAGIDVIKAITNLTKGYIVVLSGSGLEQYRVYDAIEAGAYAYEYKSDIRKIPFLIDDILKGTYVPIYYIAAEKMNNLKGKQKAVAEDYLENNLSPKEISKKHNKSYRATIVQISRIKSKFGAAWKYIFGKK